MDAVPFRNSLVVLLILLQLGLAGSVWAGETPASLMDGPAASCHELGGDHCDMMDTASQSRTACGGGFCATPPIFQAMPTETGTTEWLALSFGPTMVPLPRAGYRNPLERPPNL